MWVVDSDPTITGCTFDSNSGSGLRVDVAATSLSITGCTFRNHNVAAVDLHPGAVEAVLAPGNGHSFEVNVSGEQNVWKVRQGTIAESTMWPVPAAGFTYLIEQDHDITIAGVGSPVLTLLPGTVIKQYGNQFGTHWTVGSTDPGGLIANGVLWTSAYDDTVGNALGSGINPSPGHWEGIQFLSNAMADSCVIEFSELRYGGRVNGIVEIYGVPVEVTGCVLVASMNAGVYLNGSSIGLPTVRRCVFTSNRYGVRSVNNGRPLWRVESCCFEGNAEYGILADAFTDGKGSFSAQSNWWGNASGPSGVGPGTGDPVSSNVNFDPWAITTVCIPATGVGDVATPRRFAAPSAYPNPFNPSISIPYELPEAVVVTIHIFDVSGRLVRTLLNQKVGPGYKTAVWVGRSSDGSSVSSGVYLYRLEAGPLHVTRKIVFLK